jgi:glycosyltransferase involved in cell wall biosynthesis
VSRPRRLLVVVYPYPPMPSSGSNRWLAMAKYLRRLGHDVTVLTTSAFGPLDDDREAGVVRVADLTANARLRKAFRRPPLPGATTETPAVHEPPPDPFMRVLVPDPYVISWTPQVAWTARRLVRERGIDCIVTSSPYESTHLVGLTCPRRVAWIADFRDGWRFDPWRPPFYLRAQTALDGFLERTVVTRADRVLAATRPIAEDLERRLGVAARYVPNGWDPDLEDDIRAASPPPLDPERVSIVHTGLLRGAWGRDPGPLMQALRRVLDHDPAIAARLEFVLAGRADPDEERMLQAYCLGDFVRRVGHLPRASALALQRRADVLLLVTSPNVSEATGKLFEYLAAGKPILALADGNEAARIVTETRTGAAVPPDDVEAIARALRDAATGRLAEAYEPRNLETFRYPAPAEEVAEEVERAVERRSARS